jgi:phosphoenolpyruvate carboxykinase (ATP)
MTNLKQKTLEYIGLNNKMAIHWNLPVCELVLNTLLSKQGELTDTGALACDTGKFTGRSPMDKFIVVDKITENKIWWGEVNHKFSQSSFHRLFIKLTAYLSSKELFVKVVCACASEKYRLNIRVITQYAWQSLFAHNLFLRPNNDELESFKEDWLVLTAPGFKADPILDDTRAENLTIINFSKKIILIGGSAYTWEIKKGIFTVLNFLLPTEKNVLPMHCSANVGKSGDTSIFFGLSGTGKTTLSADPNRKLIGDDEHGWDERTVFNFEGGCYAKCVNLNKSKEPQIFNAIKFGTLLENTNFYKDPKEVNYSDILKTENTRAAYPIQFIQDVIVPSIAGIPRNIFFLTADAFGVLPPVSKLTVEQSMYHFISGYTAKVAGTETGIIEPQTTFSACFGRPFLPLRPTRYATMLGDKLRKENIKVWLINTGWIGGGYGSGERIQLKYTRALITAVLNGDLDQVAYREHDVFGLLMPENCPNVPEEILNPENSWADKYAYHTAAKNLAREFIINFSQYKEFTTKEIITGGPKHIN